MISTWFLFTNISWKWMQSSTLDQFFQPKQQLISTKSTEKQRQRNTEGRRKIWSPSVSVWPIVMKRPSMAFESCRVEQQWDWLKTTCSLYKKLNQTVGANRKNAWSNAEDYTTICLYKIKDCVEWQTHVEIVKLKAQSSEQQKFHVICYIKHSKLH